MKPAEYSCGRAAREGDLHVSNIEQSIDVNGPMATRHNQWTQFEAFPRFMEGVVVEVRQLENAGDAVRVARACIREDLDSRTSSSNVAGRPGTWRGSINAPHS
jgi:hypothetical protein